MKPMKSLPPLDALRAFEALGRLGTAKEAAAELSVTQSAISHQIRKLEGTLNIKLFERSGRSLMLNSAGREYYATVTQALTAVRIHTDAIIYNISHNFVTISTSPSFGIHWLIPCLGGFRKANPRVHLSMKYFLVGDYPQGDAAELSIRYGNGHWSGYECRHLLGTPLVPVCTPKYLKESSPILSASDLKHHTLLHDENFHIWRAWLHRLQLDDEAIGLQLTFQDQHMVVCAALAGHGIALCRTAFVGAYLDEGRLVMPLRAEFETEEAYYLCWKEGASLSTGAKAFKRWLLKTCTLT